MGSVMNYEDNILAAIQTIVNDAVDHASYDKTIQATIKKVVDATTGKYRISYQDSVFNAYATSADITYSVGTNVYVLIPGNDMSRTKTILGTVDNLGADFINILTNEEIYESMGVNIANSTGDFGLNSYTSEQLIKLYDVTDNINLIGLNTEDAEMYIKQNDYLTLGAYFKTNLSNEQKAKGNYGISFDFIYENELGENEHRICTIDIDSFNGSPYDLLNYTKQTSTYINYDKDKFKYIDSISIFESGFPYERSGEPNDIFVKDIQIFGARKIPEEDLASCMLSILTPQGTYFKTTDASISVKKLKAQIRVKGKIAGEYSDTRFYWFRENAAVTKNIHSDLYCSFGGSGWECLNQKNALGDGIYEWVPADENFSITKADLMLQENRYKCVALYNDGDIVLSREITLYNKSAATMAIESSNGQQFYFDMGQTVLSCTLSETLPNLTYTWRNIYDILDEETTDHITVLAKDINRYDIYQCTVYSGDNYIGTASIILYNSLDKTENTKIIINNGSQVFKYTVDGIAPNNASIEKPITILPLSFVLFDDDGAEITQEKIAASAIEWLVPAENTMLLIPDGYGIPTQEDEWNVYKNLRSLNFNILTRYDANKEHNVIKLRVTLGDRVYTAETNLIFLKEGERGSNGTDFVCKVIPNISGDNFVNQPVVTIYNNSYDLNYTPAQTGCWFKVQLWHDGELIYEGTADGNSTENKAVDLSWSVLQNSYSSSIKDDSNITINKETGVVTFNTTEYIAAANIVQCKVLYDGVEYYDNIPIITTFLDNNNYSIKLKENSGFNYAVYESDGRNPKFDNSTPFEILISHNTEDISLADNTNYTWAVGGTYYEHGASHDIINLIPITSYIETHNLTKNQKRYKPIDSYDGLCVNNCIECYVEDGNTSIGTIYIPIDLYINRYGNAALNNWNGNSIQIRNEDGLILSPQIGAGKKESDNTFTGMFMGNVQENATTEREIGLFGYYHGQRTIELNAENGKAKFGKNGAGQIIMDPSTNQAILTSGNYDPVAGTGMQINLTEPSIRFGSGNFQVDSNGNVTATQYALKTDLAAGDVPIAASSISGLPTTMSTVDELNQTVSKYQVDFNRDTFGIPCSSTYAVTEGQIFTVEAVMTYKGTPITSYNTSYLTITPPTGIDNTIIQVGKSFNATTHILTITFTTKNHTFTNSSLTLTYNCTFNYVADGTTHSVPKTIQVQLMPAGANGSSIEIDHDEYAYAESSDGQNIPADGDWQSTPPSTRTPGYYLWTRTITYYSPASAGSSTTYSVASNGTNGISVVEMKDVNYFKTTSPSTAPSKPTNHNNIVNTTAANVWTFNMPVYASGGVYYKCTETKLSNNTYQYSDVVKNEAFNTAISSSETVASSFNTFITTTYPNDIDNLQNQIDGAIQFWNGPDVPTLNNYPAEDWTTEAERINHQADIYTVIQDVQGELKQGKGYRFDKVNGTWTWVEITDQEMSAVQALAASKAKVWVIQPTPPYSVGDLWIKDQELYECIIAKDASGSYAATDWTLATKYTDDTLAKTAILNVVTEYGLSDDAETEPSTWSSETPTWTAGKYVWQRTVTYKVGAPSTGVVSNVACIQGAAGADAITTFLTNEHLSFSATDEGEAVAADPAAITQVMAYKGSTAINAQITKVNNQTVSTSYKNTGITGLQFKVSSTSATNQPTITFKTLATLTQLTGTIPVTIIVNNGVANLTYTRNISYNLIVPGKDGANAKTLNITSIDNVFKRTSSSAAYNPATIILTPEVVNCTPGTWSYYNTSNSTWTSITSSTASTTAAYLIGNNLCVPSGFNYNNNSTSASFRCVDSDNSCSDTITISKLSDGDSLTITNQVISYGYNNSGTDHSTVPSSRSTQNPGGWGTSVPSVPNGSYLWTRTEITYSDSSTVTNYTVSYQSISSYTFIKYSADNVTTSSGAAMYDTPQSDSKYIGITYTSTNSAPTAKSSYTWSKLVGEDGFSIWTTTTAPSSNKINISALTGPTGVKPRVGEHIIRSNQYQYTITAVSDTQVTVGSATDLKGVSATSVTCGNETQAIVCDKDGYTTATTITIPFAGYTGNTRAACSVSYSTLPSGMSLTSNTAATTSADGSLVLAVAANSTLGGVDTGDITLTFTCNSLTFVKKFTWSKNKAGQNGTSPAFSYLTNEAQTLVYGAAANSQTMTTQLYAYEGTTEKKIKIITINGVTPSNSAQETGLTGVQFKINTNPTAWVAHPVITFTTTSALPEKVANRIPIVYNVQGEESNRTLYFSYSTTGRGDDAVFYDIEPTTYSIVKNEDGTFTPTSVTFNGYTQTGSNARTAYSGRWIIQTSANGSSWTTASTSSANESSKSYTPSGNVKLIKAYLCPAGATPATSTALDIQTVSIITDGVNGTSPFISYLTNEAQVFAYGTEKTVTTQLYAYQGTTEKKVTIVSVNGVTATTTETATGLTGMNFYVSSTTAGNHPTITFKSTTSLGQTQTAQVPIVYTIEDDTGGNKTIYFSYSSTTRGAASRVYDIVASSTSVVKKVDNSFAPASVTFSGYYRDGTTATQTAYSGRWLIQYTTDGTNWTTGYTSSANESSKAYTVPTNVEDIKLIRAYLGPSGNTPTTSNALDVQTIPILNDSTDVEIGGRNYISNLVGNWTNGNWSIPSVGSPTVLNTYNGRISLITPIEIEPNTEYWVKLYSSKAIHVLFRVCDEDDNFLRSDIGMSDQKWTSQANDKYIHITIYDDSTIEDIEDGTTKIKIEKGNIATDWTASPEDVNKGINDAQGAANDAKSVADAANIAAGEAKGDVQTAQENIDKNRKLAIKETYPVYYQQAYTYSVVTTGTEYDINQIYYRQENGQYVKRRPLFNDDTFETITSVHTMPAGYYTRNTVSEPSQAPSSSWTITKPSWKDGYVTFESTATVLVGYEDDPTTYPITYSRPYALDADYLTVDDQRYLDSSSVLLGMRGSNNIYYNQSGFYVYDGSDAAHSTKCIYMNQNGINFASRPDVNSAWTSNSVWTIDGTFDAQYITVNNLSANSITDGNLTLGNTQFDGELFIKDDNDTIRTELNTQRLKFPLDNGGYVYIGHDIGIQICDSEGNIQYGSSLTWTSHASSETYAYNTNYYGSQNINDLLKPGVDYTEGTATPSKTKYTVISGDIFEIQKVKINESVNFNNLIQTIAINTSNHKGIGFVKSY